MKVYRNIEEKNAALQEAFNSNNPSLYICSVNYYDECERNNEISKIFEQRNKINLYTLSEIFSDRCVLVQAKAEQQFDNYTDIIDKGDFIILYTEEDKREFFKNCFINDEFKKAFIFDPDNFESTTNILTLDWCVEDITETILNRSLIYIDKTI